MRVRGHDGATRADRDRERHEQPAYGSRDDLYTMTDTLRVVRPASGKPKASAGLGVAPLPARMPDRIRGKSIS